MYEEPQLYAEAWNFGPDSKAVVPVWEIAQSLVRYYGKGDLKDCSDPNAVHEAKLLMLDISKVKYRLGWTPTLTIDETIRLTAEWYKNYSNSDVYDLCKKQIQSFVLRRDTL